MIQIAYQGIEFERTADSENVKITYIGTQDEIESFVTEQTSKIGSVTGNGKLVSVTKNQDSGPLYKVVLTYEKIWDQGKDVTAESETVYGRKSQTLTVRNMSLPIEKHPNYRAKWNHYLIGYQQAYKTIPAWACRARVPATEDVNYKFVKSINEITDPENWKVCINESTGDKGTPNKPGLQTFDWCTFVITQVQRFRNYEAAGSSVQKKVNTIVSSPSYGDMGISGGDWKIDDASVSYDGKYWIVTTTYSRSGDDRGWDKQIYADDTNDGLWSMDQFIS